MGVSGGYLYWKVVLEFLFGHRKCHFRYPKNSQNHPFWPFWGVWQVYCFLLWIPLSCQDPKLSLLVSIQVAYWLGNMVTSLTWFLVAWQSWTWFGMGTLSTWSQPHVLSSCGPSFSSLLSPWIHTENNLLEASSLSVVVSYPFYWLLRKQRSRRFFFWTPWRSRVLDILFYRGGVYWICILS